VETTAALGLALFGRRRWHRRPRGLAVVRLLAGTYLVVLAAVLAATLLPVVIGWRPYLITSGSMQPDVPAGSVVLADGGGALPVAVGDVVVVHDPSRPGQLLAHRVAALRADGTLITKGDANATADVAPVPRSAVIGRLRAIVPLVGQIAQHRLAGLLLAALAALLVAASPRRRRRRRLPRALVVTTAVVGLTSALTWQATAARFGGTTRNSGSTFSAGSVQLSDDDSGSAVFSASGLVPGDTGSQCVTVSYGGNVPASVRLYASASSGSLAGYLSFTVDQGTGPCASFSSSARLYNGTLAGFAATAGTYASGLGTFAPSGVASVTYRFTYVVRDDNAAAGSAASLDLTWEARST